MAATSSVHDYRGVNQAVWEYFVGIYGGGPAIPREQLDLYYPPPQNLPPAKLADSAKPPRAPAAGEATSASDGNASSSPAGPKADEAASPEAGPSKSTKRKKKTKKKASASASASPSSAASESTTPAPVAGDE